jgi:hypothetical protein
MSWNDNRNLHKIAILKKLFFKIKVALIFLAHSTFDRVAGYGLKYFDSFDHTHLGWVGKSKHLNKEQLD